MTSLPVTDPFSVNQYEHESTITVNAQNAHLLANVHNAGTYDPPYYVGIIPASFV